MYKRQEHFRAEARDIETGGAGGDHLDGATGQPESERPQCGFAGPVEDVIDRCGDEVGVELVLDKG